MANTIYSIENVPSKYIVHSISQLYPGCSKCNHTMPSSDKSLKIMWVFYGIEDKTKK